MARILIFFQSVSTASANVAGIPALARAAREASLAPGLANEPLEIMLVLPDPTLLDQWCETEILRLVPKIRYRLIQETELEQQASDLCIAGELLLPANQIAAYLRLCADPATIEGVGSEIKYIKLFHANMGLTGLVQLLEHRSREILRDTTKPTDGIISRHFNRPISTRISGMMLRTRWIRPIHATLGSFLLALAMVAFLVSDAYGGLIIGAALFHAASVFDGVDGEIARATFRNTDRGASIDALVDGTTNLGFIIGLTINLSQNGRDDALSLGLYGSCFFMIGLILIGGYSVYKGQSLNFDAVKDLIRRRPSALRNWIIWLTMRDFLALAAAVMVIFGLANTFLLFFANGALVWLIGCVILIIRDIWLTHKSKMAG